jgi:very-short-patch-repair endonuclease
VSGNKSSCPNCVDRVNGRKVSKPQKELWTILGGQLNHAVGNHTVDIALTVGDVKLAVEYDSWFWHGGQDKADRERDRQLIAKGWRVLRIKSNNLIPSLGKLKSAIRRLLAGKHFAEITLDDWGTGDSRFRYKPGRLKIRRRAVGNSGITAIDVSADECFGELDRRSLYIRSGDKDILKLTLAPQEARLFKNALDKARSFRSVLVFTFRSVRDALGTRGLQSEAIMQAMGRLRRLVTFSGSEPVGLISRITKGQYRTCIPVLPRPDERKSNTVQTAASEWRPFKESRTFVRRLSLRRQVDWYAYASGKMPEKGVRPPDIPWNPQRTYKDRGWKNWADWLGSRSR